MDKNKIMKQFLKDSLGLGVLLWFIGYVLGFIFFALVPADVIGWYIMPFGTVITLFAAFKFIKGKDLQYYFKVALVWTALAIILDYIFLVKLLNPAGGYYKLDVYVYYGLTFILPLLVGWYKNK
ncbi:MAG: hypothetical protein A2Y67_04385 [Candidatus Buchananbacteria bacterium RBG_13_39_9]|uniref:Uncharacterized protein n=1 Tax=Candidatus Buchananbacteria bacterium RBG_13_39_9 TaxID=1797531 RepID=A0A1G1XRU7_9BACT|nr:MAG: hypothetical protein A2Y67_04385 [Candidatus Buchananbacteria bacterium RBG_13_39_9]